MDDTNEILLDYSQRRAVIANGGFHLTLASPGCGKTHILAERINYAHSQGVDSADMICLTFTNRAAREILNRVKNIVGDEEAEKIEIGNVHHFCSKFLFSEKKISVASSIIDDDEAISILADYRNENEESVKRNFAYYKIYQKIIFFSHIMHQIKNRYPKNIYLHPECFTDDDKEVIKFICNSQCMDFNNDAIIYIYEHSDLFKDEAEHLGISWNFARKIRMTLSKMYYARCYEEYKRLHKLLDFEDLLLYTYDIYINNDNNECKHYKWIQVDEVQDLNMLQLAIIDLISDKKEPNIMYLGDEQQAIFSFMGAKVETLAMLREKCKGNIHHLLKNHRSPKYLLDVFNEYATKQLKIFPELLPITDSNAQSHADDLLTIPTNSIENEIDVITSFTKKLEDNNPEETTAIIVISNSDAEDVSEVLGEKNIDYFKISGLDIFSTKDMKLLLAHISVISNEGNLLAWTRIFEGLKIFDTKSLARRFVHKLKQLAILPTDFLLYEDSTYIANFVNIFDNEELVVFDTETTGLNMYEDDIIEIAAIKIKKGLPVCEPLDLYIKTYKNIPSNLGDKENPMYKIYQDKDINNELIDAKIAFDMFWEYVGNATLLGHNVNYDATILNYNLRRYNNDSIDNHSNKFIDSLKLIKLLSPNLNSYKLESLLEMYNLKGKNSHQAIDDVKATISLVNLCREMSIDKIRHQINFITDKKVKQFTKKLCNNYKKLYIKSISKLYELSNNTENVVINELKQSYKYLVANEYISDIPRFDKFILYLKYNVFTNLTIPNSLKEQLSQYLIEINTIKESDFCNCKGLREKVYITTIHKAKGLEFDNVIIYDAVEGRYPNLLNKNKILDAEDARKFYVGISRAKKRLYIAYSMTNKDKYGNIYKRELTHFMDTIGRFFKTYEYK